MTRNDIDNIAAIAARAVKVFAQGDVTLKRLDVMMDLEFCHENDQELDFEKLLAFDDANLVHDIGGLARHFNRTTWKLEDGFSPRCSIPAGGRS
jgi:hypothetical protein